MELKEENKIRAMLLEILSLERRNLKTQTKNDVKMIEEISRVIISYSKQRM